MQGRAILPRWGMSQPGPDFPAPRSAVFPAVLLALTCIAAKIAYIWPLGDEYARILAISAEDVAVCLGFALAAGVALWASKRRPRLHLWIWRAILALGALSALYALANIGIYRALRQPLNCRMLTLIRGLGNLRSSIAADCTVWLILAVILIPVAYIPLASLRPRFLRWRSVRIALIVVAVAWITTGMVMRLQSRPDGWHSRAVRNPHCDIVVSLFTEFILDKRVEMVGPFPPEYLDDFKPAATRTLPKLPQFASPPRNIILVVLESTGTQYLSLYNSKYDTTPRLLAESRNALVFDRFYAHVGYTFCEMMPLIYSVYPGPPWYYRPRGPREMPVGLAALMKQRGHRTAYFSAGNPEWGGMDYMARRAGFDEVFGPAELGGNASSWGTEDGIIIDALIRWIDDHPDQPFFALVWTDQAHDPYTLSTDTKPLQFLDPNSRVPQPEKLERYLNAVRQSDHHVGRLLDALRSRKLADDTLVVITGDHGEAFADPHDVVGHGSSLFDDSLHVPMMLWNPRLFPEGKRTSQIGGHVDLNPTLAHIYGIATPPDWQGASLYSPDHPARVYLQADMAGYQLGVMDDRYKFMLYLTAGFERLYDLQNDPLEQQDLSARRPEVMKQLRARISAYIHSEEDYIAKPD